MAKTCFCGCGRDIPRFPLGMRSINTRGAQVVSRMSRIEEITDRDVTTEVAEWFADGDELASLLAAALHGEIDPRGLNESAVREWQADGREIERVVGGNLADLGSAVRRSGLSEEQVAQALVKATASGMSMDEALAALGRGELRP